MPSRADLSEVAKLAGIAPKEVVRVSGTRAKLMTKQRPKKALKARGEIQSRGDASKTKINSRQKSPQSKLYGARKKPFALKTAFLRRGEGVSTLATLVEWMRDLLAEG
jgi:hypothetical protein